MLRRLRRSLPLACALLALGCATAGGSGPKRVSAGDYQASPAVDADADYSVGLFSVARSGAERWIERTDGYLGIYYPDANECDDYDLPLAGETVPISASGRFHHSERTPVADTFVRVSWKGRWVKPGVVAGSITIKHAGCTSTHKWRGGKVVAAG